MREIVSNLSSMLIGLVIITIPFIDKVILRPVHRRKLQAVFETWQKNVENYDHLQLALFGAKWASDFLDNFFGKKLLSKKVIFRSIIISNGILIIALSWVGFANREPFGVTPWKNYKANIEIAQTVLSSFVSNYNLELFNSIDISNAPSFEITTNALITNSVKIGSVNIITNEFILTIGTNTCIMRLSRTGKVTIEQIEPLGQGCVFASYSRIFAIDQRTNTSTNFFGKIITSKNQFFELQNDVLRTKAYILQHSKTKYLVLYSVAYFFIIFSINTFLFIGSLTFCRVILREIFLSKRLLSAIALVITNIIGLLFLALGMLLFMTLLATPLLWLLFPVVFKIAQDSLYTFCVFLLGATVTIWIISGISAKIIALIALLPNCPAVFVGGFSVLAIKWRKGFYLTISGFLIRCVENSPLTVIWATAVFTSGLIAFVARLVHLTAFL